MLSPTRSQKAHSDTNHQPSGSNHSAIVCPKPQSEPYCRKPCSTKMACGSATQLNTPGKWAAVVVKMTEPIRVWCGQQWKTQTEVALLRVVQSENRSLKTQMVQVHIPLCVSVPKLEKSWKKEQSYDIFKWW